MEFRDLSASKWGAWAFYLSVFCLPFQTQILLYQTDWGRGFVNPYASIWITSSTLLCGVSLVACAWNHFKNGKKLEWGYPGISLSILAVLTLEVFSWIISPYKDPTFHMFLLAQAFALFGFYLAGVQPNIKPKKILNAFVLSMFLQSLLAGFQGVFQKSLGLYILGEPHLITQTAQLAKIDLFGGWIRGYGTFPHPNILAGFLAISLLATGLLKAHFKHQKKWLLAVQILGFFFSFSRSASLALLISVGILASWTYSSWKNRPWLPGILGFILFIQVTVLAIIRGFALFRDPAILERFEGIKLAAKILITHPFGVGAGHYTLFMDQISSAPLAPWEYQPVHNAFLLAFVELGLIGGSILLIGTAWVLIKLFQKRKKWLSKEHMLEKRIILLMGLSLVIIAQFDHYLFSLDLGKKLALLVAILASHFLEKPTLSIKKVALSQQSPPDLEQKPLHP